MIKRIEAANQRPSSLLAGVEGGGGNEGGQQPVALPDEFTPRKGIAGNRPKARHQPNPSDPPLQGTKNQVVGAALDYPLVPDRIELPTHVSGTPESRRLWRPGDPPNSPIWSGPNGEAKNAPGTLPLPSVLARMPAFSAEVLRQVKLSGDPYLLHKIDAAALRAFAERYNLTVQAKFYSDRSIGRYKPVDPASPVWADLYPDDFELGGGPAMGVDGANLRNYGIITGASDARVVTGQHHAAREKGRSMFFMLKHRSANVLQEHKPLDFALRELQHLVLKGHISQKEADYHINIASGRKLMTLDIARRALALAAQGEKTPLDTLGKRNKFIIGLRETAVLGGENPLLGGMENRLTGNPSARFGDITGIGIIDPSRIPRILPDFGLAPHDNFNSGLPGVYLGAPRPVSGWHLLREVVGPDIWNNLFMKGGQVNPATAKKITTMYMRSITPPPRPDASIWENLGYE